MVKGLTRIACTFLESRRAAMGSMLFRSPGNSNPLQ
jgi:hypothetical protein